MAGKIFISYRRDDDPSSAARVCDGLAQRFGRATMFMDVDNLLAGQRFDEELAKALAACDVLIAILGPRWMEVLRAKRSANERDYVILELSEALKRKIVVVPVRVGREGQLQPLPRAEELPEPIRDLVLYQKHDVTHERFGRDIAELADAIAVVRRARQRPRSSTRIPWGWIGATAASVLALTYVAGYYAGMPIPWPWPVQEAQRAGEQVAAPKLPPVADQAGQPTMAKTKAEVEEERKRGDAERQRQALARLEESRKRVSAESKRQAVAEKIEVRQQNDVCGLDPPPVACLWRAKDGTTDVLALSCHMPNPAVVCLWRAGVAVVERMPARK